MKRIVFEFLFLFFILPLNAQLTMPAFFDNHMVLQRNKDIVFWGSAKPYKRVTIQLDKKSKRVYADSKGNWKVSFNSMSAGGPYTVSVKSGKENFIFSDVYIGELWVAAGQSNMEFKMDAVDNAAEEIEQANFPLIRSFNVEKEISHDALNNLKGNWRLCKPEYVVDFSAVAYFFAKELHTKLNVPVGIINSSWGGTDIETWMSAESIAKFPRFQGILDKMNTANMKEVLKENDRNKRDFENAFLQEKGLVEKWYSESYSTKDWKQHFVPALWNSDDLMNIDGVVWFSYELDLPDEFINKKAEISLGQIDDDDITWINGVKVGETSGYDLKRKYTISEGVLKKKNKITVKISDFRGNGGMYGVNDDFYLKINNSTFPLHGDWLYKISFTNDEFNYFEYSPNTFPSLIYNAMIHPLIGLNIQGVIWYQGENNAVRADEYKNLFPTLISDWRNVWKDDFSFYWVQLANFMEAVNAPSESHWANLRDAQTQTLKLPKTGQAVIIDIGDADDIHPTNKQDVGKRLSLIALHHDYGFDTLVYSGPMAQTIERKGSKLILSFDYVANGMFAKDKYGYLKGFSVAGEDGVYYWAQAEIQNDKILVYSLDVSSPISVRYAWADNPNDANLYNSANLPASPFQITIDSLNP